MDYSMSLCMNIGTLLQTNSPDTEIFKYEQIQEKNAEYKAKKTVWMSVWMKNRRTNLYLGRHELASLDTPN